MSLAAGQRLGPYEIASPLGAGGMGEVWRARDTRLDREARMSKSFNWTAIASRSSSRGCGRGKRQRSFSAGDARRVDALGDRIVEFSAARK